MSTVDLARSLSPQSSNPSNQLTGYVRNTTQGSVEGEVQAADEKIVQQFIDHLKKSPAGRVDKVETREIEEKRDETRFQVK
ncbi:hypothetical protein PYCC9005_004337 [Savitreella phatthalungensis]